MSKIDVPGVPQLAPEQLIAIAGAVKGTAEKAAKDSLPDGYSGQVDFKVRVTGTISKTQSTPGGPYEMPASVSLATLPAFCRVLRSLGIGPVRLRRALDGITPGELQVDGELSTVFDEVAREIAVMLPPVKGFSPGSPAKVFSQIAAELIP